MAHTENKISTETELQSKSLIIPKCWYKQFHAIFEEHRKLGTAEVSKIGCNYSTDRLFQIIPKLKCHGKIQTVYI